MIATMKFDNSKRMEAVQDLIKSNSKKKLQEKKLKKQRSGNSLASSTAASSTKRSNSSKSLRSTSNSSVVSTGSASGSGSSDSTTGGPTYKNIITLQQSWEGIKATVKDGAALGEQALLLMIQESPTARESMGLVSLRSERAGELSKLIVEMIDVFIFLLEPADLQDEDLQDCMEPLVLQGIDMGLFAKALPTAVEECLLPNGLPPKEKAVWTETMHSLLLRAAPSAL